MPRAVRLLQFPAGGLSCYAGKFSQIQLISNNNQHRKVRRKRRGSVPDVFDFESYKLRKGFRRESWENEREFARNIWNQWFDQVSFFFPWRSYS